MKSCKVEDKKKSYPILCGAERESFQSWKQKLQHQSLSIMCINTIRTPLGITYVQSMRTDSISLSFEKPSLIPNIFWELKEINGKPLTQTKKEELKICSDLRYCKSFEASNVFELLIKCPVMGK